MSDRTTKMLLFAIALGLWCNIAGQWLAPAHAQSPLDSYLTEIRDRVGQIANGTCTNDKIC